MGTNPRAWLQTLTFSDATSITLGRSDIVVIVGPNNAGKSAALRAVRDKVADGAHPSPVVTSLTLEREGSIDELIDWLETTTMSNATSSPLDPTFQAFGSGVQKSKARKVWNQSASDSLGPLARFFCHLLTADERLIASNPADAIALARDAPSHPIHFLQRDDRLEERLSANFRKAFSEDLVVQRNAGSQVPLHVGAKPSPGDGEDRLSYNYIIKLEELPRLQIQGDGMRSFVGVLLNTSIGDQSILLIDEPEAFLHPPQARLLGRMLVTDKPKQRQLLVATHSGDVIRGVMDGDSRDVRIIRIRRSGNVNQIKELDQQRIAELWGDPLLRYSNILDGLFHEQVVVSESDADARFYAAIADALFGDAGTRRRPDVMFTHCGGKARLPLVIRALRAVDVPVSAVADFDLLRDEQTLRAAFDAAGGSWPDIEADWMHIKHTIESRKPELNSAEVVERIRRILDGVSEVGFPDSARKEIETILRSASPWATAKSVGKAFLPSGAPMQACERVLSRLRGVGVHVVETGELESFLRTVGGHGPAWVNEVLRRDLANDPALRSAREFVASILDVRDVTESSVQSDGSACQ